MTPTDVGIPSQLCRASGAALPSGWRVCDLWEARLAPSPVPAPPYLAARRRSHKRWLDGSAGRSDGDLWEAPRRFRYAWGARLFLGH